MNMRVKRFDTDLPLPNYATPGAACVDLCARVDTTIAPGTFGYIPLNVAIEIPEGYWVVLAARSSTHKTGLLPANGLGIIDSDFRGDNDELHLPVYNVTKNSVTVTRGQRIAQMTLMHQERIHFEEVVHLGNSDRGGFGTTGTR